MHIAQNTSRDFNEIQGIVANPILKKIPPHIAYARIHTELFSMSVGYIISLCRRKEAADARLEIKSISGD
jgi:hypothetical protein